MEPIKYPLMLMVALPTENNKHAPTIQRYAQLKRKIHENSFGVIRIWYEVKDGTILYEGEDELVRLACEGEGLAYHSLR